MIYARQIAPEWQESPIFLDGMFPENIVVTGQPWKWSIIRGCCQSDWQEVFYPVNEWGREALTAFEVEYFNTGSEWIVHEGEFNPEQNGPEDIEGHSIYCTSYKVQEELQLMKGLSRKKSSCLNFPGFQESPYIRRCNWCISFF